jgi:hypothetical protein
MTGPDAVPPIPEHIGPCGIGRLGTWVTMQCPDEFDGLMLDAGAVGSRESAAGWSACAASGRCCASSGGLPIRCSAMLA